MKLNFVDQTASLSFADVGKLQAHLQSAINGAALVADIDDSNTFLQLCAMCEVLGLDVTIPDVKISDELPDSEEPDLEPGDVSISELAVSA